MSEWSILIEVEKYSLYRGGMGYDSAIIGMQPEPK